MWNLVCSECGIEYDEREVRYVCPVCATEQRVGDVVRGLLEVRWKPEALRSGWETYKNDQVRAGFERMRPLLPLSDSVQALPLLVGDTPLCPVLRLRTLIDMPRLWVKDDTRNPSGSYKDRASALVCLKAIEYGETAIVAASTGNAASALACLAASLGQNVFVIVPSAAPPAKLTQILCYGARVLPVLGSYDDAFELSLEATRSLGWYNRNTGYNPFTVEGKKTCAVEIVRDLGYRAPDVVVVPTGDGVILAGIAKGFRDLVVAGAISSIPRLIAVQASGAASLARAVRDGGDLRSVSGSFSVADSICVDVPRAGLLAMRDIRATGGGAVIVDDGAILSALADLARISGIYAEPAAAASLAGLRQALSEGLVSREEETVLLVTGGGLKDTKAASLSVPAPFDPVKPDLNAIMQFIQRNGKNTF